MFYCAVHSAVYFSRRTVFTTLYKQTRLLSVSAVSSTKNLYSESILFSEKQSKSAKAKKSNGKKLEQSQLYPDGLQKLYNCDFEEFDLLMDDTTPSIRKDPTSDKLESMERKFEAVDKMPSAQELQGSVKPESKARRSEAVDKMPSMQELQGSVKPESKARRSEAVDKMPSMQELQRSFGPESEERKFEAVDKMPSMQELQRSFGPESEERKFEAVDKMPSMQELQRSFRPESEETKFEAVKGLKISETEEIDLQENDLGERLSDSDSENEAEDYYSMRKRVPNNFQINLKNLRIRRLGRRNRFLRNKIEEAIEKKDEFIINNDIKGIILLARLGITPELLFFCSSEALRYFPADLSNTALYTVPLEDIMYWSLKIRTPKSAMIGIYKKEYFKLKTSSSEPEMPLTIICDQIWHKVGFAQILNSAYMTPPKLFITSKDCISPWEGIVLRQSLGNGIFLNHDIGLTWEEICQKVDKNDRVYLLELALSKKDEQSGTDSQWLSLPSVHLYDHGFWDVTGENVTLIVTRSHSAKLPQELSKFCSERNVSRIDAGLTRPLSLAGFHMVFFELRRQWLAAESRNLGKSGSK